MIIELFGLPASGKTTLAKLLSGQRGLEIIKIRNRAELIWYNFLFLIYHPAKFFILLGWLVRYVGSGKLFYFKLMNFFFDINARYQKAKMKKNGILDQGYFQNLLSLFEQEPGEAIMKSYLKILPRPDVLIILDIPVIDREEYIRSRGYFSRERMPDSYREQWKKIT